MDRKNQYIESNDAYHEPSRDPNQGFTPLVVIVTILMVALTSVLAIVFYDKKGSPFAKTEVEESTVNTQLIVVASPTPTPVPNLLLFQNPILYPPSASGLGVVDPEAIVDTALPNSSKRSTTQMIMVSGSTTEEYLRETPVNMGDPLNYSSIAGITTFRGNNFRNCASFGYCIDAPNGLKQVWEFDGVGSKLASTMNFEWTGVAWTGQPLIVRWDENTKYAMNIYDSQKAKVGLTEVIIAALDGKIYFFNLDDGSMTRDPIFVGASVKGTPALDPRGYPLIYVGQGDDNGPSGFGMRIFSLLDGSCLYFCDGMDENSYRKNWGACDSSPIVDANSDTLIWPSENGIIYTFKLNTQYNSGAGTISVSPQVSSFKYIFNDSPGSNLGVESSVAVYGGYAYFCDNNWNLICLDLNTLTMVWQVKLDDDTDVSPVIEEENGVPYLYVCTEVDGQGDVGKYNGAAYTYKFNGLTGEEVWQTSCGCYTYNGESSDSDQSGGCFGNPIIGKRAISNMVIFSYSMTNDLAAGNKLVAYDKVTGNKIWEYQMNIYSYSSPVDVYDDDGNAYIIIGDSLGQIHLVDALTGVRIKHIQTAIHLGKSNETTNGIIFEASPAVFENRIVIGTKSGSILAIDLVHEESAEN